MSLCSFCFFFFFFQAEDGIRDPLVTGVQTCALPISGLAPARQEEEGSGTAEATLDRASRAGREVDHVEGGERIANAWAFLGLQRSEERRVGKECRYRWSPDQ